MDHLYRRNQILEILRSEAVRTQEALRKKLARRGIVVTQATVSRDIEELGLVKRRSGYRLPDAPPDANAPAPPQPAATIILKEFVREVLQAAALVVVKTSPGNAHSVGVALDAGRWEEVVGTVAGDDTVFIATPSPRHAASVRKKILAELAA
ncbi:MAG: ArgR family transcriptional regulator [Acidobacteria bacterium]|nr:ArgR family transcriptional regulator [Acidobacteriota bacterium]